MISDEMPRAAREALSRVALPHVEEIGEIVSAGDVAIVLALYVACPLIERLRGTSPGPVIRRTQAYAVSMLQPDDDAALRTFLEGTDDAKVLVAVGRDRYCVRFNRAKPRHLSVVV